MQARTDRCRSAQTGTVAFFHPSAATGSSTGATGTDLFVHHTNIGVADRDRPARQFAVRDGRRGLEAYDVVAV